MFFNLKRFLFLFIVWLLGFGLLVLQYDSRISFATNIPELLIIIVVAAPTIILLSLKGNERQALFFLVLFSASLRFIIPLGEGSSSFIPFRDPIYTFEVTKIYQEEGKWVPEFEEYMLKHLSSTPAIHFLSVALSEVTGINLFTVCRFLPSIVFTPIIIVLLFYSLNRLIGSQRALLACFFFSVCYKFNFFESLYIPESLGVVFFIMAFYALISKDKTRKPIYAFIFSIAISTLVWTHFLTGYIFLGMLVITFLISLEAVRLVDVSLMAVLFLGWVIFVSIQPFIVSYRMMSNYFSELTTMFLRPWENSSGSGLTGIHLTPLEMAVAYSGILIPLIFAFLTSVDLFTRNQKYSKGYPIKWLKAFSLVSLILGLITILGMSAFSQEPDMAYRFIPFLYIFLSVLSSMSISHFHNKLEGYGFKNVIFFLLIIPVISTGLLIPAFIGETLIINDKDIVYCSSWLLSYSNESTVIIGDTTIAEPIAVYSRRTFWRQLGRVRLSGNQTMYEVIYYGGNISALVDFYQQKVEQFQLVIDKQFVSHKHYLMSPIYHDKIPIADDMENTIRILNQFSLVNKIYESESPTMYMNVKGK